MHNDFGALRYQSIASKLQYAKRYSRTPGATSMHACGKRVPLLNADMPGKPRNMVAELCNDEFAGTEAAMEIRIAMVLLVLFFCAL